MSSPSRLPQRASRWRVSHRLRIHVGADGVDLGEHALQARARDLVAPLDDRRRSVERRQPARSRRRSDRRIRLVRRRGPDPPTAPRRRLVIGRIDRQKQRVRRRQRAQLIGMPPRQRAIARKPAHQLVPRFERRRGQLRLHEPPEHPRVILDEIDGRQQRRPVQLAAEPQLADSSIPRACRDRSDGTAPGRIAAREAGPRRPPAADSRQRPARGPTPASPAARVVSTASMPSSASRELARLSADEPVARALDDRGPCLGLADAVGLGGIGEQARERSRPRPSAPAPASRPSGPRRQRAGARCATGTRRSHRPAGGRHRHVRRFRQACARSRPARAVSATARDTA